MITKLNFFKVKDYLSRFNVGKNWQFKKSFRKTKYRTSMWNIPKNFMIHTWQNIAIHPKMPKKLKSLCFEYKSLYLVHPDFDISKSNSTSKPFRLVTVILKSWKNKCMQNVTKILGLGIGVGFGTLKFMVIIIKI